MNGARERKESTCDATCEPVTRHLFFRLVGGSTLRPLLAEFHLYLTIYNYNSKGRREKQSAPQTSNIVTLFSGAFVLCQFVVKFEDPVKGHAAQYASTTLRLLH